ncbi:serine/threonine protein kinase [Microbacterium sp. SLBN-111]
MVEASVLPEASTLQAIDHSNVVKVVSAARVDGYDPTMDVIEIHTPYYPRGSIADALMRGEGFPGQSSLNIVQAALRGLRELHMTHLVLHRDIKSGNVLLDDAPVHGLIADIGVAGRMDDAGCAPAVNNPTLYSPPEWRGGVLGVSADLYSLALVLRELVGGRFDYGAYSRGDVLARLERGMRALPDSALSLPVWAPLRLRRIYGKAIALDPRKRHGSARELAEDLAKLTLSIWVEAEPNRWTVRGSSRSGSRLYAVTANTRPDGVMLSMTRQSGSQWRRVAGYPDKLVPALTHKDAVGFFTRVGSLAETK